jgi:hypothetical protein
MHRLKSAALTVAALAAILSTACAPIQPITANAAAVPQSTAATQAVTPSTPVAAAPVSSVASVSPGSVDPATLLTATIRLGDPITIDGAGAAVSGNTVTVTAGGTYRLTGTLGDGQVVVAAKNSEAVQLILDGAGITSSTSAPVYVKSAKSAVIVLADGSTNYLADGASRPVDASGSDEPNAALYSVVDLTIGGNGSLAVDGRYNDGIASKDDLDITGGSIAVTSVADGIRGRDSLKIDGGNVVVNAGKDGLKSSNDEDPEKGVVTISAGTIQVTAREDGIQAETDVAISGGTIAISTGGGSTVTPSADVSAKGIKGTAAVAIDGGSITIDAADDALHSNGSLAVRGGTLLLASADDGMHADVTLDITGGAITVANAYEGIESARITIADGTVRVTSRDDALNGAGGSDGATVAGRPGQNSAGAATDYRLTISGGYVVIDSGGDGLDANGTIEMTGGVAIVHGPTQSGNGAIDYDRGFTITGGTLIAAGSAGMAQAPGSTSTQPSVQLFLPSSQPAGTLVYIGTASGEELLTFAPTKAFQSLVVSSAELEAGTAYVAHTGGSSTGTVADGLYSGGAYTAGDQVASFTVAGAVTTAGSAPPAPGRGGRPR